MLMNVTGKSWEIGKYWIEFFMNCRSVQDINIIGDGI